MYGCQLIFIFLNKFSCRIRRYGLVLKWNGPLPFMTFHSLSHRRFNHSLSYSHLTQKFQGAEEINWIYEWCVERKIDVFINKKPLAIDYYQIDDNIDVDIWFGAEFIMNSC